MNATDARTDQATTENVTERPTFREYVEHLNRVLAENPRWGDYAWISKPGITCWPHGREVRASADQD